MPPYEILALKYAGPNFGSGALMMWMRDWDLTQGRNSYFWCLRGGEGHVLVDCGASPEDARGKSLPGYIQPDRVLAKLGVAAGDIELVILTHLHWDHAGGLDFFPKARFMVQKKEYDFWLENPVAAKPLFKTLLGDRARERLRELKNQGRLDLLEGDCRILPGVESVSAPGHTAGLMGVRVHTSKGWAVLASDCAHSFANLRESWPSCIIFDLAAWADSFERIKQAADRPELIFPGHDTALAQDYPPVAENITRLA